MNTITIRRITPVIEIPAITPDESLFPSVASGELLGTEKELVLGTGFGELNPSFDTFEAMLGLWFSVPSGLAVEPDSGLASGDDIAAVTPLGLAVNKTSGVLLGELSDGGLVSCVCGGVVGGMGDEVAEGILLGVLLGISFEDGDGVVVGLASELHLDPSSTGFNLSNDVGGTRSKSQVTHLGAYEGSQGFL